VRYLADLSELALPNKAQISFPDGKEKPMHFEVTLKPDEGYYR
jgi:ubiquitin-conjugating enzyme E2 M